MARGRRPPDPRHQSDIDPLEWTNLVEAVGRGAEIGPDHPLNSQSSIVFGRIAEGAVEYHATSLRQGTVGKFRARALNLVERALAEECWLSGARWALERLEGSPGSSRETFADATSFLSAHSEEVWRGAAALSASILRDIEKAGIRKGKKGRPTGSGTSDALAALFDRRMLEDAKLLVPPGMTCDRDAVAAAVPAVVREYTRLGQLRRLGATDQESIDRHSKRLRNALDRLLSDGGFSPKRKSK